MWEIEHRSGPSESTEARTIETALSYIDRGKKQRIYGKRKATGTFTERIEGNTLSLMWNEVTALNFQRLSLIVFLLEWVWSRSKLSMVASVHQLWRLYPYRARALPFLIAHDLALIVNIIDVDRALALSWNVPIWAFAFWADFWFILTSAREEPTHDRIFRIGKRQFLFLP